MQCDVVRVLILWLLLVVRFIYGGCPECTQQGTAPVPCAACASALQTWQCQSMQYLWLLSNNSIGHGPYGGFLKWGSKPPVIIHFSVILPLKPSSYWCTPIFRAGNPQVMMLWADMPWAARCTKDLGDSGGVMARLGPRRCLKIIINEFLGEPTTRSAKFLEICSQGPGFSIHKYSLKIAHAFKIKMGRLRPTNFKLICHRMVTWCHLWCKWQGGCLNPGVIQSAGLF